MRSLSDGSTKEEVLKLAKGRLKNPVWNELLILEKKLVKVRNSLYSSHQTENVKLRQYNHAIALLRESIGEIHSLRQKVRKMKGVSK